MTEFNERNVRIQIKDQIDRMKRKKLSDDYEFSGSDEEGSSLDPPTIKKQGAGEILSLLSLSLIKFLFRASTHWQSLNIFST